MSLDGGLSALRAAIASGRPVELSGSGADASLTIDGVAYPAMGETTFAGGRLGATARRYYKLVALWMQHKCGASAGYSDYLAALREAGIANAITIAVMVTDRAAVMDYLEGRSTAHEHIASSPAATARAEGDKEGVRRAALRGEPINLVDGGLQKRAFTYIDDGIDALALILENKNDIANGKIYNIGNPTNNHSVKELANMMLAIANRIPEYQASAKLVNVQETTANAYYGSGYQDVQNRVPKIENTMAELGWKPTTTMEDALEHIFEAYRHDVVHARSLVDH